MSIRNDKKYYFDLFSYSRYSIETNYFLSLVCVLQHGGLCDWKQ